MLPGPERQHAPLTEDWLALKDTVRCFESAWRRGLRPQIDDYLPSDSALRSRALVELVHIELELRLKAAESARVEDYIARYPELAGEQSIILELIAAEHELRGRREPELALDEYLARFPEHRAELPTRVVRPTEEAEGRRRPAGAARAEALPEVAGYEVSSLLGRGGMGVVYKARQQSLDRPVALKFLPEECARDPAWLARFRREARTASALNHPHICTIYDTGESAGRPFLCMELVEGHTLEMLIVRHLPMEELAGLLRQAAQALAAAHAAGIVHHDIKPANLMVRDDGIVKVLDFGLARRLPEPAVERTRSSGLSTAPGARGGTPLYMSPEQARAESVDAATDIFSLGIVLYELATGQHPFRNDSELGVLQAILAQPLVAPSRLNPEVPAALDALTERMLAKDPRLRPSAAEVEAALAQLSVELPLAPPDRHAGPAVRPTVGRQEQAAALRAGFDEAAAGRGLLLCVTGEPGLGKTTLVESFLDELAASGQSCSLARGRCSERLAGAEAYLPFLEALDSLLQGTGGASAAQMMKLLAPTWYVQLAPLAAEDPALARVLEHAREATQERRKRELGVFLKELSRHRSLIIFLEDIHWADPSSVDLLAYLGSRCADCRMLVILTYRPSDLLRSQHPFGPIKLDLQGRGACREIALPLLCRDDLARYLELAFAGHAFPEELAAVIHAKTEGNPLFMVDLLRYLRDRGVLAEHDGRWSLERAVPDLQRELPESVRGMIQRKMDGLSKADRRLLMAASVQGPEFDSAVVARVLGREAAEVEERLDVLDRVHALVRLIREQTLPDGALTQSYGFVHVLYQNALYTSLRPTRKATWSAAAAQALLDHYGEKRVTVAAELAVLYEAARDHQCAADHYLLAARNAARLYAHHEAAALARRGLALVHTLPDTPERASRELTLQVALGIQLQVSQGYATAEVGPIYTRALALCEQLEGTPLLFSVIWGLWMFHEVRCELGKSRELAERLLALAEKAKDRAQLIQAHQALVVTSLCLGDPIATRKYMEQGVALYDPERHCTHTDFYGQDPRVGCQSFGAIALWLLGYPDQALERSRDTVALANALRQPSSQVMSLYFSALLGQHRRDSAAVLKSARATLEIANEHALSFWQGGSRIMTGWALTQQGDLVRGIAQLREGVTAWAASGGGTYQTYHLALLAEALGHAGQAEEGLKVLAEALALMERTDEGFHAPELHRLQGELLLLQNGPEAALLEAEACFRRALAVARTQQARSFELRAAVSLARLYQKQNCPAEARPILAECYEWFTEGFDTPDLQEAKALLEQIS